MMFQFRFDKNFNPKVLIDHNLELSSREGLTVKVKGTFWDTIQLKQYPFIKDLTECKAQ